ncbi:MAG: hypothetical protein GPW19_03060 [Euryarchaeota archaeon]|nr:hypothetical protein [Euryarchaeota archaeon]
MSGAQYARELMRLLGGDKEIVEKYIRSYSLDPMSASALSQTKKSFRVGRSAGSKAMDLLAVRMNTILPIEIKSSSSEVINFTDANSRNQRQYIELLKLIEMSSLPLFYAVRLKNAGTEPWHIFIARKLRGWSWVPVVSETKSGNVFIKWSDGIPLSEFLRRLME